MNEISFNGVPLMQRTEYFWKSTNGTELKLPKTLIDFLSCFSGVPRGRLDVIATVKYIRMLTGWGLKDAKDLYDAIWPQGGTNRF